MPSPEKRHAIRVLVFTPTPTHPSTQGNRKRVCDLCLAMQSMGAELTVLYYATEGLNAVEARQMRDAWGEVDVVFPRDFILKRSLVRSPAIDDWYDGAIDAAVRRIVEERTFDVCIVNYAWYSRLFEVLPRSVVRVIDTHDVFGDRANRFIEIDLAPEWFHTSVAQERLGLDRADFVVAIQDEEAETLRQRTSARVDTVGFLGEPDYLPARAFFPGNRLRVGYVGSGNPFNVSSMISFARAVEAENEAAVALEFQVAGSVCKAFAKSPNPFLCRGIVSSLADFYNSVDVVANPMRGGTGLKIKSLEALAFGKPLAATTDAMVGIASPHAGHRLPGLRNVVQWLLGLARAPDRLVDERMISRNVFDSYRKTQLAAFRRFWSMIEREVELRRAGAQVDHQMGIFP